MTLITKLQQAQEQFDAASVASCKSCGAKAKLTWRQRGYGIECIDRFTGCPMNGRTHRNTDLAKVIAFWNTVPANKE